MVYQNVATDFFAMTDLETGIETPLLPIPFDTNPGIGLHVSGNCYAVPGWVLISTNGARNAPSGKQHSWMDNLLFMLELKDSPRVVKLAQTHCYTGEHAQASLLRRGLRQHQHRRNESGLWLELGHPGPG